MFENRIVPIRERVSGIPPKLAEVIDRSVAAKAADRYPSAGELRDALARVV